MKSRPNYKTADGVRVPSVTTILGNLNKGDGLLVWANRLGLEGKTLEDGRRTAMDAGSLAHALIEADSTGELVATQDIQAEILTPALRALQTFREWKEMVGYRVLASEVALVSEKHRYGGMLDAIAFVERPKPAFLISDWKTGAIYLEHYAQVAAYGALVREAWDSNREAFGPTVLASLQAAGFAGVLDGALLLRLGKEDGSFDHHYRPADSQTLVQAWKLFLLLRQVHDTNQALKKVA